MSKTPGQKVFEGYRDFMDGIAYDGSGIPEWEQVNPKIRDGWEAGVSRLLVEDKAEKKVAIVETANMKVYSAMVNALNLARQYKLGVSSDKARFYAVAITEQEKAVAYMKTYVLTLEELEASPQVVT